jgi:hypothetical protein
MTDTRKWWERLVGVKAKPDAPAPTKERMAEIEARLERDPLMNFAVGEQIFGSLIERGDQLRASGDTTGALEVFTAAAKYAIEQGQGQSPGLVTAWRKKRAVAASRMGNCYLRLNDLAAAKVVCGMCLTIFQACAADDPADHDTIWDVFLAHRNLVAVLEALNLPDEAAAHYEVLVNAWHESTRVPADAPVHFLSISSGLRLAEIRREQGDADGARAALTSTRFGMIDCGGTFPEIAWIFIGSPDTPRHQALLATGDPDSPERTLVDFAVRHAKAERELDAPH